MILTRDALMTGALDEIGTLASYRRRALCSQPMHRDVSLPQLHVLLTLQERGRMTVSELASLLEISTPSTSAIVDRMEDHQYVTRTRDVADRRVVHVEIAEAGRHLVEEMMGMREDTVLRLLSVMTDEELHDLTRGIQALRRAADRLI